jgi:hypothetical protein
VWRILLPAALLAALTGCGGSAKLTGKVTYKGQPVLSGTVTVLNEDGTAASGVIQPDGTYAVEGVKRGRVKIGVVSPDPARARSILKKAENKDAKDKDHHGHTIPGTGGWFPLPPELGDPEKSGIELVVSSSRMQYDIEPK